MNIRPLPAPSITGAQPGSQEGYTNKCKNGLFRQLTADINDCKKCELYKSVTFKVPGTGNLNARIMLVGEAPGRSENEQGKPFVGRAGKLLTNMLLSIDLTRDDVFIANILKCWPPNNRKPTNNEMQLCIPYLYRLIKIIEPKVIIGLGNTALEGLTGRGFISSRCGNWETIYVEDLKINLMPCYHPAALLRNPKWKEPAWYALQKVKEYT